MARNNENNNNNNMKHDVPQDNFSVISSDTTCIINREDFPTATHGGAAAAAAAAAQDIAGFDPEQTPAAAAGSSNCCCSDSGVLNGSGALPKFGRTKCGGRVNHGHVPEAHSAPSPTSKWQWEKITAAATTERLPSVRCSKTRQQQQGSHQVTEREKYKIKVRSIEGQEQKGNHLFKCFLS